LGVAQRPGAVLDRIRVAHLRLGFGNVRYQRVGTRDVVSLNIAGGWREIMRLLGSVRPVRLLAKFTTGLRNGSFDKQLDGCRAPLRIVRAYRERSSWVAALETTTHTFLCEGLGAHNSIAQHCCIVADAAEATGADAVTVLSALLHDASEAYLGDLPHPLKHRSPLGRLYREIEEPLQAAILARFQLPAETPPLVKRIDRAALAAERAALMRPADDEWWPELDGVDALELAIEPWPAERGAREFLDRFERLEARR
jgi:5'-deoxynucleotidase YfbR-like HD superfamily hydrolase